MYTFLPRALLAFLACFISFCSSGQIGWHERHENYTNEQWTQSPKFAQRFNVAVYGMCFSGVNIDYKYKSKNYYGRSETEAFSVDVPAHSSYACGLGTFFPLAQMGAKSKLCLSLDVTITAVNYNNLDGSKGENIFKRSEWLLGMDDLCIPITLDYKTGCDVMQTKDMRTCFSVGFGACYRNNSGIFYHINGKNINNIVPALRVEGGVFWGWCMKLRMMYQFGQIVYMKHTETIPEYEESVTMTGRGNLVFSLLVMPTARSWSKRDDF